MRRRMIEMFVRLLTSRAREEAGSWRGDVAFHPRALVLELLLASAFVSPGLVPARHAPRRRTVQAARIRPPSLAQMVKGMMDMIGSLYKKALYAILRSSIALMLVTMIMDKFGILAVRNAFYDSNRATDHVIHGYANPLKVRDWDKALLEYTLSILTDSGSKSKTPLSRRLTEISCPVIIITGDGDRIVPAGNAVRLSKAIPNACLEVIKNCGHLPHEERVDEFLSAVEKFLQKFFGGPEQQLLQATV